MFKEVLILCALLISGPLHGKEILLWDMDNGATISHVPSRRRLGTERPVAECLERLGHRVTVLRRLPENLSKYDAVFITLGYLAPS